MHFIFSLFNKKQLDKNNNFSHFYKVTHNVWYHLDQGGKMEPVKRTFDRTLAGQIQIQLRPTREENNFINDFLSLLASSLINTDLAASAENACG